MKVLTNAEQHHKQDYENRKRVMSSQVR